MCATKTEKKKRKKKRPTKNHEVKAFKSYVNWRQLIYKS